MKVLLVLACILWLGADAYHTPEHNLRGPPFVTGRTHRYELWLNMTAGVPGMSSQVAKSVMQMDVIIRSKSATEYLLKVEHVKVSEPKKDAESPEAYVPLRRSADLERDLSKTIKFTYSDGEIKSYTLGVSESLESRSIKRGILRHLQSKLKSSNIDSHRSESEGSEYLPIYYNVTERDEMGTYDVFYLITMSPYPWFPYEKNVFNVSKTMNYESYGYPSVHEHNNFASQGSPEVCRHEWSTTHNRYGAGCPVGYEPHQSPLKASKSIHYNLRLVQGSMVYETIMVDEKNIALMYDQDMVVNVKAKYELKEVSDRNINEPQENQEEQKELNTYPTEDELKKRYPSGTAELPKELSWVYGVYENIRTSEVVTYAENLLNKIVDTVVAADVYGYRGQEVGKDVVYLQEALTLLKKAYYETLWRKIVDVQVLRRASEKEKVKRQILLDVIPLVGTEESVKFITHLITEKKVSVWEAKGILEAIPSNLIDAREDHVKKFWELIDAPEVQRYHALHSAVYMVLAKTIRAACIEPSVSYNEDDIDDDSSPSGNRRLHEPKFREPSYENRHYDTTPYGDEDDDTPYGDDENSNNYKYKSHHFKPSHMSEYEYSNQYKNPRCSPETIQKFIRDVSSKLKSEREIQKKIIYLQALSHVGHEKVLKIMKPYAYGVASDTYNWAPADIDYLKTVTLYALHNLVYYYPTEILKLASPIYFNRTETPRVRTAAFSVSIRSQPTLAFLQHVAQDSWYEHSQEVGSYVYTTLVEYGNASLPYMVATASKIKQVISQTKNFDIGFQYSRSTVKTFYDELRNFGVLFKSSVVQNNESYVPSNIYTSLGYNMGPLREDLAKFAINIQGVSIEDIIKALDLESFGLKLPNDIPSNTESEIFGHLDLLHRVPKDLRLAIFSKIFYSESYTFVDADTIKTYMIPVMEYLRDYSNFEKGTMHGHFVSVFIPSSLHSVSYSGIGFPISTRVKHPLIISFKLESKKQPWINPLQMSYYIRPSVYYTTYYSHAIFNTADHYAYGAYHEQVYTFTLPIEVEISAKERTKSLEFSYKLPESTKKIYRYRSEAGTFIQESTWATFTKSNEDRETIKTIPTLFQRENEYSFPGLPSVYFTYFTEDIQDEYDDIPQDFEDVVGLIVEKLRNPGWRRREMNATLGSSRHGSVDKVTVRISYNRTHKMPYPTHSYSPDSYTERSDKHEYPQADGLRKPNRDEDQIYSEEEASKLAQIFSKSRDPITSPLSPSEAEKIYHSVAKKLPKVIHEFYIGFETNNKYYAELAVEYNHTYDREAHVLVARAEVVTPENRTPYKVTLGHVMLFLNRPNEFRYNYERYQTSKAPFYQAITFGENNKVWTNPDISVVGGFWNVPYEKLFSRHEFAEKPGRDAFVPDTHEECLKDVREGKSQSPACMAAIVEEAQYNRFHAKVTWRKDLPSTLQNITYTLEDAIKYYYYSQADINRVDVNNPPKTLEVVVNYINKLTDEPVIDVFVKKPYEEIMYNRVSFNYVEPISSLYTIPETYIKSSTNYTYEPYCSLMENYINTYDMKTYPLPKDSCTYVLSAHCTQQKKFVVLAKQDPSSRNAKEITVYVAEHKIVFKPASSKKYYTVIYKNQPFEVKQPFFLDKEALIHVYPVHVSDETILVFHADRAGIKIEYDGKNAKLEVSPFYKGELCGLCSEYDGEIAREYRGPNQCWYYDSEDFAHSSVVDGDKCGVPSNPKHPALCPSEDHSSRNIDYFKPSYEYTSTYPSSYNRDHEEDDDSYKRGPTGGSSEPKDRTIYVQRREFVCFSTTPVPTCPEGYEPTREHSVSVDFHCLPKYDATTRRLMIESKTRVLRELAAKKVDFSESVKAASSCSSNY